jgi:two-component system, cell cycle sensor histidine kinase and response regulator CckA
MVRDPSTAPPPTVALVNDNATYRRVLTLWLQLEGLVVHSYESAEAALLALDPDYPPALIITDIHMPGIDGWQFCQRLRSPEYCAFNSVPILVVSATFSGDEAADMAADVGADAFLPAPVEGERLISTVRGLLRGDVPRRKRQALIAERVRAWADVLREAFEGAGYVVTTAGGAVDVTARLARGVCHVAVVDHRLMDDEGGGLFAELREQQPNCVCIVMGEDAPADAPLRYLHAGAAAFVAKPFAPAYLLELCDRAQREQTLLRTKEMLDERTVELRQSETRLRLALFGADLGTYDWDVPSGRQVVNERWAEMLGYSLREIEPHVDSWRKLVHPDDLPFALAATNANLRGETDTYRAEFRMRHKSGKWMWILAKGRVITRSADGTALRACGTHLDITERKQAEAVLAEREAYLRTILQTTGDGLWVVDLSGRIREVNDAAWRTSGYTEEELLQLSIWDLDAFEQQPDTTEHIARVIENGSELFETVHRRKDGAMVDVEVSATHLDIDGGQLVCFIRDISGRKQAEAALAAREAYLRTILQTTSDGFWVLNSGGVVVEVNDAYCAMSGYSREELLQMGIRDLDAGEAADETAARIRRVIENGAELFETRHRRKDGGVFDVEVSATHLDLAGGQFVCFCRDVTERKRAEELLRRGEEKYRGLFENAPVGIFTTSPQGRAIAVNTAMARMLGLSSPKEAMEHYTDLGAQLYLRPERRREFLRLLQEHGYVENFEYEARTANGCEIWLSMNARVVETGDTGQYIIEGFTTDITERKQAEAALRASEAKFRSIAEETSDFIALTDENGVITYGSSISLEMFGHTPEEMCGRHFAEYLDDESAPRAMPAFQQAMLRGERTQGLELTLKRSDGSRFVGELNGSRIRLGGEYGTLAVIRDITERKQSEARLRTMAEMLDTAPSSITIHDVNGRFLYANRETFALHGYSEDEFLAINLHELDVPESEALLAERFALIEEEGEASFEVAHYRKDGTTFPLDVFAKKVAWEGMPAVLSIATDISERKRAEAERERLITAIEQADDIVVITDVEGIILYVNPAFERTTGYSREEAIGRTPSLLKSGEQDEAFYQDLWETITSGESWRGRIVNKRKDGTLYLEEETISPVLDRFGETVNYVAVKHDITREEQLEQQFVQAQKMESVGRLAGGVAHDFNNMLGVILGHTEMALDRVDPSQPVWEDLTEIQQAAERSASLTRQLLAFARRQTVAPKVLDLNDTVSGMLRMLRRLIGEDINLIWKPGASLWPVKMDPTQVDQILANLSVNARDAISGVGNLTIETRNAVLDEGDCSTNTEWALGEYVQLVVRDDGCGMEADVLENLFQPYFTTKRRGKGTGLGLATVYGIIRQNNGFVGVESAPGLGTTFNLFLPRYRGKIPQKKREDSGGSAKQGDETILLVEDETAVRNMVKLILERLGYQVVVAGTPEEALLLADDRAGEIHLLVTDVIMPEMNGQELAQRLLGRHPTMKRLFMSGYTADVIARSGMLEEGISFIQKPFSTQSLAAKIREVLDAG